tara:strand:- start:734 stop:859 length:126 start_codon:yes stop_codon:yes gene_type:complete
MSLYMSNRGFWEKLTMLGFLLLKDLTGFAFAKLSNIKVTKR